MSQMNFTLTVKPDAPVSVVIEMNAAAAAAFYNFVEYASRPSMDWRASAPLGGDLCLLRSDADSGPEAAHADFVYDLITTPALVELVEAVWDEEEEEDEDEPDEVQPDVSTMTMFAPEGFIWCSVCEQYEKVH